MRTWVLGLLLAGTFRVGCDCGTVAQPGADAGAPDAGSADLAIAYTHGCRLDDGVLRCFGTAPSGALGVGDTAPRLTPTPISSTDVFVAVVTGGIDTDGTTCALDVAGDVYCWGANARGQLGVGDFKVHPPVPASVALPVKIRRLGRALFSTFCAIGVDGTLWCWGQNDEGQLGQGDSPSIGDQATPIRIGTDADWLEVACGQGHTCGIRDGGLTFCWGRNTAGHLGLDAGADIQIRSPTFVPGTFHGIVTGQDGTCALTGTHLYCWGAVTEEGAQYGPLEVAPGPRWTQVSVNTFHACALDDRGQAWCFGRNDEGQLGQGDIVDRDAATPLPGQGFARVVAGRFSTCLQGSSGTLCTGDNGFGELGVGDTDRTLTLRPQP